MCEKLDSFSLLPLRIFWALPFQSSTFTVLDRSRILLTSTHPPYVTFYYIPPSLLQFSFFHQYKFHLLFLLILYLSFLNHALAISICLLLNLLPCAGKLSIKVFYLPIELSRHLLVVVQDYIDFEVEMIQMTVLNIIILN